MVDERVFAIAREVKDRVAALTVVVDCRLFGSRARGDGAPDSDLDLYLVVESLDNRMEDRIIAICWEIGYREGLVIAPVVVSRHEIEQTALRAAPLIANIRNEGIAV